MGEDDNKNGAVTIKINDANIGGEEAQKLKETLAPVAETTVTFKAFSDRTYENIVNAETREILISISGYDLRIGFNLQHLQTVEDIEAALEGIKSLFRNMITEALLEGTNTENA